MVLIATAPIYARDSAVQQTLSEDVYRERINFSKIKTSVPIPNLIEIQKKSYNRFLQMGRLPSEREEVGLQSVFKSVFPIQDFSDHAQLEFVKYELENPKYDVEGHMIIFTTKYSRI